MHCALIALKKACVFFSKVREFGQWWFGFEKTGALKFLSFYFD